MNEEIYNIRENLVLLAVAARDITKIKKGESTGDDTNDYTFDVKCLKKNTFKVCFHTKKKAEVLEDPTLSL